MITRDDETVLKAMVKCFDDLIHAVTLSYIDGALKHEDWLRMVTE